MAAHDQRKDGGNAGGHGGSRRGYRAGSMSLAGAVAMGTGVMIGAGIFALTGQIAELAGGWFPLVFLAAAVVTAFDAYAYIKLSADNPSAGGIAMYLKSLYGKGVTTGGMSLLMYFSMVINEALVARTFGEYAMQLTGGGASSGASAPSGGGGVFSGDWQVPALAVGVLLLALVVNVLANRMIGAIQLVMAAVKVVGIAAFAGAGLWATGWAWSAFTGGAGAGGSGSASSAGGRAGLVGVVAAVALGVLSFKGFTTLTNEGDELKHPERNVGRAIVISIVICAAVYLLVALAVGGALSVEEIVAARDYALAEAARPAFGRWGAWLTAGLALVACVSGLIASVFAVSRMLAMLTRMDLVPYRDVGIPGRRQYTTLVFTIGCAVLLAVPLNLARVAALGAIFYLVMDMAVHWGVLRHARRRVGAARWVLVTALVLDAVVLAGFTWDRATRDPLIVGIACAGIVAIFVGEWLYLRGRRGGDVSAAT